MKLFNRRNLWGAAAAAIVAFAAMPASATSMYLQANGLMYTLTDNGSGSYNLFIKNINSGTDTEGGRYGVESFAFGLPTGFVSATPPSGFSLVSGGLNSSGCNSSGNFFCFDGPTPASNVMAAGSTLSFDFAVNASGLATWMPDFKINWIGTKNNYNLVSLDTWTASSSSSSSGGGEGSSSSSSSGNQVPEPSSSLVLLGLGLIGLGFARRVRARA